MIPSTSPSLKRLLFAFVARVIGWLVLMFSAWFILAPALNRGLAAILEALLTILFPDFFAEIQATGKTLEIVTRFLWPITTTAATAQQGWLVFTINPLIYGYGLPFFLALVLAVPEEHELKPWTIGLSLLLLFFVQLWGIGFDIFKTLLFSFGPEIASRISTDLLTNTLIAYGYQLGTLILPVVVPVMLWLGIYPAYWQGLMSPPASTNRE